MSFLSFYNDDHGKGNEALLKHINNCDWEQAEFAARTDPLHARWKVTIPDFYDGKIESTVYPLHISCTKQPPAAFVKVMHKIHSKSVSAPESTYKRMPLHLACMNSAPTETIAMLIELNGGAVKKKDSLGRLPIHYASKDENMTASVGLLLKHYPGSAKVADKQGFLPLHVSCRCGMPGSVIRELITAFPAAVNKETTKGSTPVKCANSIKDKDRKKEVLDVLEKYGKLKRESEISDNTAPEDGN
jgi:hypothetical protein